MRWTQPLRSASRVRATGARGGAGASSVPGLEGRALPGAGLLGLDQALDTVVLHVLGVGEADDLADQADRDDLDAEHDQERAQDQRWPLAERHIEEEAGAPQPSRQQHAQHKDGEAEAAEEAEGLSQEAEQEEDRD